MSRFDLDQKGSETFPLIVLFGVILAFLMAFLFITLYSQQLDMRVDEQAKAIADDLAQTAFTSFSGGQPILDLPRDVGGSPYEIKVDQERGIFMVEITGGRRAGNSYSAIVSASLKVDNQDFSPGGRVYFMENVVNRGQIIVSAAPISAENIPIEFPAPSEEPPEFYLDFARHGDNQPQATAVAAAYFEARELFDNIDVSAYEWSDAHLLVQITENGVNRAVMQVTGEDDEGVGEITKVWLVKENIVNENTTLKNPVRCPSPADAYRSDWLYSKQDALDHLRSRTWQRENDNTVVAVPADASIHAAAATTNISLTYPTWRVTFEGYVIFYRMMPWWENDEEPGFVFQSGPAGFELEPIV